MYYIATIIIGWSILNFLINTFSSLLGIESLYYYFLTYVIIGYIVMGLKKIPSPMQTKNPSESPVNNMKSLELKLFFKEVYYILWWPYYLIRKN